jgi:hypothetical protein
LETFHDLILTNESDFFEKAFNAEHFDELLSENRFKETAEIYATHKSEALSSVPHTVPGLIVSYVWGWLGVIHDIWINICAVFTTILIVLTVCACCSGFLTMPVAISSRFAQAGSGLRERYQRVLNRPPSRPAPARRHVSIEGEPLFPATGELSTPPLRPILKKAKSTPNIDRGQEMIVMSNLARSQESVGDPMDLGRRWERLLGH